MPDLTMDQEKLEQYKEILNSPYVELHELTLMLAGHKFYNKILIPTSHQSLVKRKSFNVFILQDDSLHEAKEVIRKGFPKVKKDYEEKFDALFPKISNWFKESESFYFQNIKHQRINDKSLHKELWLLDNNKETENFYDFYKALDQKDFLFCNPHKIIRQLFIEGFIFPVEIQHIFKIRQDGEKSKKSKKENRHLQIQATGLALVVLSNNKIGIEDLCRHKAMKEMCPYYAFQGKMTLPKDLLKVVVPKKVRKKGNKPKNYFYFDQAKLSEVATYYLSNKPLPGVVFFHQDEWYINVPKAIICLETWWKMHENKHFLQIFFQILSLLYFEKFIYFIGYMFPSRIFENFPKENENSLIKYSLIDFVVLPKKV